MHLLFLLALPLLLCLVLMLNTIIRRYLRNKQQQLGLLWLSQCQPMLSDLQKHRGLSHGFLSGGKELLLELQLLHAKVQQHIETINATGEWITQDEQWLSIQQHWRKLSTGFRYNTVDNNLAQHNLLIKNLLSMINNLAEHHQLLLLAINETTPLHITWRDLLQIAETIGQARAIGTGVAASRQCLDTDKIKLNLLCQRITQYTQEIHGELTDINEAREQIEILLFCINQQIIQDNVSIDAQQFFNIATEAMDGLYEDYQTLIKTMLKKAQSHNSLQFTLSAKRLIAQ